MALMGPGAANTMAGKALMRGLERAIRDKPELELRAELTDIRDRIDVALTVSHTVDVAGLGEPIPLDATTWQEFNEWDVSNASDDGTAIATGE